MSLVLNKFLSKVNRFSEWMEPILDDSTIVLGELAGKRFSQYNEETERGFRVKIDRLLSEGLRNVKIHYISDKHHVVEIIE
jgi:hypothetical protein